MKRRWLILLLLVFLSLFTFCRNKENENITTDPDEGKEIVGIHIDTKTIPEYIDIDDFDLSVIKVVVEYLDGSERVMDLKEDMVDSKALEILKRGGSKRAEITYKEEFICTANLTSKDFGANDPKIGDNDVIILVKRNKEEERVEIRVLSNNGISSLQLELSYDTSKISLDLSTIRCLNNYNITESIEGGVIKLVLIAKDTTLLTGDNVILDIKYTGNYREAAFNFLGEDKNKVLRFENGELIDVTDTVYHYSLK